MIDSLKEKTNKSHLLVKRSSGLTRKSLFSSCNGTSQDGNYLTKPHLDVHNLFFVTLVFLVTAWSPIGYFIRNQVCLHCSPRLLFSSCENITAFLINIMEAVAHARRNGTWIIVIELSWSDFTWNTRPLFSEYLCWSERASTEGLNWSMETLLFQQEYNWTS